MQNVNVKVAEAIDERQRDNGREDNGEPCRDHQITQLACRQHGSDQSGSPVNHHYIGTSLDNSGASTSANGEILMM